ncbi:MAG: alginate lyase family protein [Rickettsiales bacterium]
MGVDLDSLAEPKPIEGLYATKGYGADNNAEPFSWYVMVAGGRALAGDKSAETALKNNLLTWAKANAFSKSDAENDTYYALKRVMLPVIVNYAIIYDSLSGEERETINGWIDPIVRKLDKNFHGEVDHNNHRYLADSVLMAWGALIDDDDLYQKGVDRYRTALTQAKDDGSLPLEARRGARAQWYMRQSLADMTVMAEIARLRGKDLYGLAENGKNIDLMITYFMNTVRNPLIALPQSAANFKPGPNSDYFQPDMGMLERRPQNRHYMAFTEALLRNHGDNFAAVRLAELMKESGFQERPLIDDFLGGNGTCFFWNPTMDERS